jgi:hypothetical protein
MSSIDRNRLMPVMHQLVKQGGFWGRIGEAAMLADESNLERLVKAYPEKFIEGQTLKKRLLQLVKG